MGSGPSLGLSLAESTIAPGKPSIISEPIEHDYDAFLDESMAVLKYPVSPMEEPVLKECKVTEDGDEIIVKVTFDGPKLTKYGYGNPEDPTLDKINQSHTIRVDRAGRKLTVQTFKPCWIGEKEDDMVCVAHLHLLRDPFRLEYYWELPDGTRRADDYVLGILQPWVNGIMAGLAARKVSVKFNSAKPSAISEPVEESVVGYEALFDSIIAVLKKTPPTAHPTVEEISETKAKLTWSDEAAPTSILTWDKEAGTIMQELTASNGDKLPSTRYSLSKSPVVLEVEVFDPEGKSVATVGTARLIQGLLDLAIAQATNSGGWFGGMF